jgi:hypothetical protein
MIICTLHIKIKFQWNFIFTTVQLWYILYVSITGNNKAYVLAVPTNALKFCYDILFLLLL